MHETKMKKLSLLPHSENSRWDAHSNPYGLRILATEKFQKSLIKELDKIKNRVRNLIGSSHWEEFSYFISNLLELTCSSSLDDRWWFLYPITKEKHRVRTICLD